ncbi:hypothetical protein E3226_003110 [Legionella geestiana]|uniref:VOC family protein n=1 Tax=Legionella geestiana TaxID=45065 RepID=UPI00109240E4|nr:VOC family protein [Legionella geestiana]QDQ39457.1 hypothetical protein E3226_003110 [Legionella geestiana]
MLQPNVIVLYAASLAVTSQFYREVFGMAPVEASSTFHSFKLSNDLSLAIKAQSSVLPPVDEKNSGGELAFVLESRDRVNALFTEWHTKNIRIILPPTQLPFGYTFVALDPDGYRLRFIAPEQTS